VFLSVFKFYTYFKSVMDYGRPLAVADIAIKMGAGGELGSTRWPSLLDPVREM
jgi:hypothetical protein